MKLFHAFPRPKHRRDSNGQIVRESSTGAHRERGLEILRLILSHGLVCTPEEFSLYPNRNTINPLKRECLDRGVPHDAVVQSRACFSLVDTVALSKEYQLPAQDSPRYASHVDLFGEFAIGLDPVEARSFGVLPAVYYYRHDIEDMVARTAGLGSQIVERLDEIRNVFAILSHIEDKAHILEDCGTTFPSPSRLKEMNIEVRLQPEIRALLDRLTIHEAKTIFDLFNTDRVPAWNLFDLIGIFLSLYQTTDSTIEEDAPLAFFHQREWRVVHHKMIGIRWYGLGEHESTRNPLAEEYRRDGDALRHFLLRDRKPEAERDQRWFLDNCWVLAGTDRYHFRDFIRKIVVPPDCLEKARDIVNAYTFKNHKPAVVPLARRWRRVNVDDQPEIHFH